MRVKVGYFSLLEISASEHLKKNSRILWVAPDKVKYGMYYLYEIMALFLDPATIASVLQLGPSGPINPATSLEANAQWINLASFLNMTFFITCKSGPQWLRSICFAFLQCPHTQNRA